MLFRKKIEPRCEYCGHAGTVSSREVVCKHKGVVDTGGACRRFKYDPLKRVPPKPAQLVLRGLSDDDFNLD